MIGTPTRSSAEISTDLEKLAAEQSCHNLASTLWRLAADLKAGEMGRWSNIDLLRALGPDEVVPDTSHKLNRWLTSLDLVRNVFLFLPLLFTWGGIFFAAQAYRDLLNAPFAEQEIFKDASFLQMWTRGFGGRTWVTLDVVALLDFLAITAVVVLFVGGGWLQRRANNDNEMARRRTIARLRSLATETALAVADYANSQPDRVTKGIRDLVPVLEATLRSLVFAQRELASSMDTGKSNVSDLVRATSDLSNSGKIIASSADNLTKSLESIRVTTEKFDNTANSLIDVTGNLKDNIPLIRGQLQDFLEVAGGLGDRLSELHNQHVQSITSIVLLYGQTLQTLRDAQSDMVAAVTTGKKERCRSGQRNRCLGGGR